MDEPTPEPEDLILTERCLKCGAPCGSTKLLCPRCQAGVCGQHFVLDDLGSLEEDLSQAADKEVS
jgi:hypothetical protein